tara:strand:+ start:155 stop:382 length:228 start_codon:yes stop_codon:yes gene_type:complete
MSKHDEKFELMLKNFKEHKINLDAIEDGYKKTILIGIEESLDNVKLIAAAKALYMNYSPIRLFSPVLYKLYMKTK